MEALEVASLDPSREKAFQLRCMFSAVSAYVSCWSLLGTFRFNVRQNSVIISGMSTCCFGHKVMGHGYSLSSVNIWNADLCPSLCRVAPRLGQEPGLSYIKCHFSFIECYQKFVIPQVYHKGTENMQYGSRTSHLLRKHNDAAIKLDSVVLKESGRSTLGPPNAINQKL